MIPERRPVFLEVVDHEEYVEVDVERDASGKVIGGEVKKEGARTAFLHLRAPDGRIVRAEIPHGDLDPILALIYPEDFASAT